MSSTDHLSELESLRSQVTDLTRALAERDQSIRAQSHHPEEMMQNQPEQSDLLRAIVEGTVADTGEDFFRSLVKHLAQALKVRYAFVGEWRQDTPGTVRSLAVWSGSALAEPFEYDLRNTPCDNMCGQRLCLHESGVQRLFPEDHLLAQMEVESYCGTPLFDRLGKPLGLLVVMDDRPMARASFVIDLLQIFAIRAAAELQRQQAEAALRESESRLRFTQFAIDHAQDGVLWADDSKRFVYANEAACRALGYSNEELLALSIPDIAPYDDPSQFQQRLDEIKQGRAATYEFIHRRKDGTKFPVEASVGYLEHEGRGYTCGIVRDITERKRVEQERAQALADLRNVMETIPDILFTLDTQGNMVKWNRRVEEVTGYSPEELWNKHALAFVPPEEQTRTAAAIQRAFTEGYAELEGHLLTKDLRTIPYHWTGALLKNAHGEPIGITGVGRDVSEKKQAEEELTQQRRHLIDAQALAHLGSWDWDIDTGEVRWSDEQFRIFGHEPGSISVTYDTFLASLHPDDHDRILAAINDALLGKRVYDVEYRIVRPNGEVRFIHARGDVYRDATGHPLSMAGTVLDITERKRIEDALRASEERWHLAVRGSNDGIWDWNIQTGDVFFSSRWKAMRGFEDHEIKNDVDEWRSRIHPDDLYRVLQSIDDYLAKQIPEFCKEYRVQHKDGSYLWILDRGVALWADDGTPLRMAGSESDITERKRTEEALRESEARFTLAVAGSNDILWDAHRPPGEPWYAPQTLIWWSPRVRELLGLEESESFETLNQWAMRLHPDDKDRVFGQLAAHIEHRVPYDAEYRLRNNRGDYLWIRGRGQASWDEQGEIRRMSGSCQDITERKRTEEALRKSEERYARATAVGKVGVWELDMVTGTYHGDPNLKALFGYVGDELSTDPYVWLNLVHPDDQAIALDHWQRIVKGETNNYNYELRMLKKDGTVIWTDIRGHAVRDHEGQVTHLFGATVDISERKQAQDALVQSEHQLRTVLNALPVGVWFTDRSGKPLLTNPAAKQIWSNINQIGLRIPNNPSGWWETIEPVNEPHRWALSHALTTGVPSLNETLELECLDGTKKTIRNSTVPVQDEAGVVLGAIVLNEDITALRQAQEALKLTQFSVDHAVEGFFWISPDARILYVNEAACRMLEYTRDELTAMTIHDINPNFPLEVWPAHWEELKQKKSMTFESNYWSRTGRVLDTEVTVNYLYYEGREYNCAIMRDIGERKRAEASLRQSEERYRSLVDNAPIGIFVNEAGRFVYANREMQRILKAPSAEQLLGTTVLDRIAPEFHQMVKDRIHELMDNGQPVPSLDEQYVRLDGSRVDVAVTAIPTSFDGTPVMQVLVLDITERKQLAEREASRVRQLKRLYELSMTLSGDPGVFFEHAVRTIGELFNVQVVCLSEIVGQELYFKSVYVNGQTLMDAGHCSLAITPCATVERTKDLRIFDRVMERFPMASFLRDHQAVSYCGFPALDNEGRVVAVTCLLDNKPHEFSKEEQDLLRIFGQRIATEIERNCHADEQKRAADELRRSHAFIRQIIDTDPNFIFAKDREGRFTLVNQAVADAYGATVDQLIGKTDADFDANLDEVEFFRMKDLEVMDSLQERFIPEETITDSTGRTRWLQTVKRPILDEQGRVIMVLGAATDITERKRMEEALRQRERDLRAAIEERQRISQDLHDGILQSLFAVGLTLEASKSMMSPRARKTSGAPLDQAIEQLNRVMHEIRNFIAGLGSDLLQGKDLATALQHMLESLTQSQATRVRLAVEDRAAKAVSAEQSLHLLLVIQEAVSNCIRHGRAQEATVSLKMLKQGVRLSIRDNGRGFNPEAAKGTGHGLRNMAARAQKIGGRFTVMSKVNEGTRIVLDLPKEVSDVLR